MSNLAVFAYCAAMGFAVAATIASFYQWVTSERAELFAMRPNAWSLFVAVLLSMFCGPFIVVRRVVEGLQVARAQSSAGADRHRHRRHVERLRRHFLCEPAGRGLAAVLTEQHRPRRRRAEPVLPSLDID